MLPKKRWAAEVQQSASSTPQTAIPSLSTAITRNYQPHLTAGVQDSHSKGVCFQPPKQTTAPVQSPASDFIASKTVDSNNVLDNHQVPAMHQAHIRDPNLGSVVMGHRTDLPSGLSIKQASELWQHQPSLLLRLCPPGSISHNIVESVARNSQTSMTSNNTNNNTSSRPETDSIRAMMNATDAAALLNYRTHRNLAVPESAESKAINCNSRPKGPVDPRCSRSPHTFNSSNPVTVSLLTSGVPHLSNHSGRGVDESVKAVAAAAAAQKIWNSASHNLLQQHLSNNPSSHGLDFNAVARAAGMLSACSRDDAATAIPLLAHHSAGQHHYRGTDPTAAAVVSQPGTGNNNTLSQDILSNCKQYPPNLSRPSYPTYSMTNPMPNAVRNISSSPTTNFRPG